jgi:SAM (Sterile alpha motif) domain-containing protein
MDVGAWLRGLGLGQYEAAFAENEIDASVLPDVTADDLKEIGVAGVGHRRKILGLFPACAAHRGPRLDSRAGLTVVLLWRSETTCGPRGAAPGLLRRCAPRNDDPVRSDTPAVGTPAAFVARPV